MADAYWQETEPAQRVAADELGMARVETLIDMLARHETDMLPKPKRAVEPRRPVNLDLEPEEEVAHIGITGEEAVLVGRTLPFQCPACRDTGEVHKLNRKGEMRNVGGVCQECAGSRTNITTVHLSSTRRSVTLGMELVQIELTELNQLRNNAPDHHTRKLAKLLIDAHNIHKQAERVKEQKKPSGRQSSRALDPDGWPVADVDAEGLLRAGARAQRNSSASRSVVVTEVEGVEVWPGLRLTDRQRMILRQVRDNPLSPPSSANRARRILDGEPTIQASGPEDDVCPF